MPIRTLLLLTLALTLRAAPTAHADPIITQATLTHTLNVGWSFDTGPTNGRIIIDANTSRKLGKLDHFSAHLCSVTFDPESRIDAGNGTFYTLLHISKCN